MPGDAQTVQVSVEDGVVTLTGSMERWSTSDFAGRLARQTPGTVSVKNHLSYGFDDRSLSGPGMTFGVA
ncbi:BON domain-containing protein [Actinoplanes sp. NPDC051633]|uniref:BON domain-containing protein n=1 Tax=Actinoplanes sp. NPDC051633 TaxID=3155670 RepID=UPI00341C12B8